MEPRCSQWKLGREPRQSRSSASFAIRELVEAGERARSIVSNVQNSPTLSMREILGYLMEVELALRSALDKIKEVTQ